MSMPAATPDAVKMLPSSTQRAAGTQAANPEAIEALAARAQHLAEQWDRPADAPDPLDVDDPLPDDTLVDHTAGAFDD